MSDTATFGPVEGVIELYTADVTSRGGLIDRTPSHSPTDVPTPVSRAAMATPADYYHYEVNGEADSGWGCAYRAVQTMTDCIVRRVPDVKLPAGIPSIRQLQTRLAELGSIPVSDVGSHRWIEPPEGAAYLRGLGVPCTEGVFVPGKDSLVDLANTFFAHCASTHTVWMIDDKIKAYAVGGIVEVKSETDRGDEEKKTADADVEAPTTVSNVNNVHILLLDPHVKGNLSLDTFEKRMGAGAVWIPFATFFDHSPTGEWLYTLPTPAFDATLVR